MRDMGNTDSPIGVRGRYVEQPDPDEILGTLRIEACRWTVDGPHHLHEFRYIEEARTSAGFIIRDQFVEHWIEGRRFGRFGWGHGSVEAYTSSQTWRKQYGGWYVDLVSSHIFRHDLPCCGGIFVTLKEVTGYSTMEYGFCEDCGKRWEIGDGHHFMMRGQDYEGGLRAMGKPIERYDVLQIDWQKGEGWQDYIPLKDDIDIRDAVRIVNGGTCRGMPRSAVKFRITDGRDGVKMEEPDQ